MSRPRNKRREYKEDKADESRDRPARSTRNRASRNSRHSDDRSSTSRDMVDTKIKPANDVTWYTKSMEQVTNSANISFMDALGKPLHVYDGWIPGIGVFNSNYAAPGVMRIGYVPTFGNPLEPNDPINIAANKTYAWIRYYNSGAKNYDAPDYMKYVAVMDTAFAYAGFLIRTYGLANSYSAVNRYWPEVLFDAMGVDFDSIHTNLAPLRTYINNYISKVNSLAVPTDLPIFARHFWMCSNVYKDADSLWAQCYIHVPEVYAKFDTTTSDVKFYQLHDRLTKLDFAQLNAIGDDIINSIMQTQDFYIMSGDTIKAFGDKCFKVEGIASDFILYPVYDAGVLNQIMSSFALGDVLGPTQEVLDTRHSYIYSLYENTTTGGLSIGYEVSGVHYPKIDFAIPNSSGMSASIEGILGSRMNRVINLTVNDPNPLHVIESTRVTAIPSVGGSIRQGVYANGTVDAFVWQLDKCGADVYTTFEVFTKWDNAGYVDDAHSSRYCSILPMEANIANSMTMTEFMILVASFDWHPVYYPVLSDTSATPTYNTLQPVYVDIYRCAVVEDEVLKRIHEVANLSLFDVTLQNSLRVG